MDEPLHEVGAVAARLFTAKPYVQVRLEDVATRVIMPRAGRGRRPKQPDGQGRSLMWLYGLIQSKGQAVALGAAVAWQESLAGRPLTVPPQPALLRDARSAVSAALAQVTEFIGQRRFLFEQLASGLSDLPQRRNSLRRKWPDTALGRVVAGARDGRCVVFADWLVPALAASSAAATVAYEASVRPAASELSDLVFRAVLRDRAAVPAAICDGLAAYWFERYLLTPTGSPGAAALRDLDDAERAVRLLAADSPSARLARAAQARAALATGRAHRRAAVEYEAVVAAFVGAQEWAQASDAASRLSLALHRWGDLGGATRSAVRSRQLAADHLGPDDQRIPRADTMAANAATAAGRPAQGLALALDALTVRMSVHARENSSLSWRRLSLSQESCVQALAAGGQVSRAVAEAAALVADRERRLQAVGGVPAPLIEARRLLGYALLEQGRLGQARDVLTQVIEDRQARGEHCHANTQRAVADLARCLLLLGSAGEADALLTRAPGVSEWFAGQVSFRVACGIWRYRAEALLGMADAAGSDVDHGAVAELLTQCEGRLDAHGADELDPLRLAVCRSRARALRATGDVAAAVAVLTDAVNRQRAAGEAYQPRLLATRCELGSCLAARGGATDLDAAAREFGEVTSVPVAAVDEAHPYRLAARVGLARVEVLRGGSPRDLLAPFAAISGERLRLDSRHPVMRAAAALLAAARPGHTRPAGGYRGDWDD